VRYVSSRRPILVVAVALGALLPAAAAQATFHLEKVNEVLLAGSGGDAGVQFVELLDKGGTEEAFTPVFAPYKLVVYDGAGKQLAEQTLDPNGLRAAASAGTEYLLSTAAADSAFGVKGDEKLTVTLPADAGQVCFQGSPGNVSCMSYGSITKPAALSSQGTGAVHGPVPAAGLSDQRQSDDTVKATTPTPKAANRADVAGASGGTSTPFAGMTLGSHSATVGSSGTFAISISCPKAAKASCSGSIAISVKGQTWARRHVAVPAGRRQSVKLRLSAEHRAALRSARRVRTAVRIVASDGSGARKTTHGRLTLRPA